MSYEYQVAGRSVALEVDKSLIAVRYSEPAPHSVRAAFANKVGLSFENRLEVPNEKFTILPAEASESAIDAVKSSLPKPQQHEAGVARITPVFRLGKVKVLATERVLVGLKDPNEPIAPLLNQYRTTDIKSRGYGEYTVCLAEDVDPLKAAKELSQNPKFIYAEPDFVNIGSDTSVMNMAAPMRPSPSQPLKNITHRQAVTIEFAGDELNIQTQSQTVHINVVKAPSKKPAPGNGQDATSKDLEKNFQRTNDQFTEKQYAVFITEANKAWELQNGDPNIVIAVLDEGVDSRHEDLKSAIVAAYDAIDEDEFQDPNPWDGHGTACAGLAAAIPNNELGIRGIGGGCSLMAIRIACSERPNGQWVTPNGGIANAIDWSWRHNADVLSNSWGSGAPSNAIVFAVDRARKHGRNGKGCVVIAAAGNDSGPVSFPAFMPGVMAVSASNEYDEIKTESSQDGEDWWGTNFGPEISIAAPGVHNYTTDITGNSGYNSSGHYFESFNGTSSATPIVAGAAALVLSANPNLTESQVRDMLCQSADKVGAHQYVDGRNDYYGFGRLNVLKAIEIARSV